MELPVFKLNQSTKHYETGNPDLYIEVNEQGDDLFHFKLFWSGRSLLFVVQRQTANNSPVIWFFKSIGGGHSEDVYKFESFMEIFVAAELMKSFLESYQADEKNILQFDDAVLEEIIEYYHSETIEPPKFSNNCVNFIQVDNGQVQLKKLPKSAFNFNEDKWLYEADDGNIGIISVPFGYVTKSMYKISINNYDVAIHATEDWEPEGDTHYKSMTWKINGFGGKDIYGKIYRFRNDFEIFQSLSILIFFFKNYFPPRQNYKIGIKNVKIETILSSIIGKLLNKFPA